MPDERTNNLSDNSRIAHYQVVSKIGAGGMGEVYLAQDTRLERRVALKILPATFAQDAERMRRFVQEAKAASALNHPNILTIYEFGETDNTKYIASEYVEGENLRERLKREPLNLKESLDVAVQIMSALAAAHGAGVIHRDIKPDNVMIRPDGLAKLLDFGIAKLTEKKTEPIDAEAATAIKAHTKTGTLIGTAAYMSPEQARGKTVDARSDIFSFGLVLYEMLSGKAAFAGENAMDVISSILQKEPVPLSRLMPDVPHEIERIVNKALRKDCEQRYQTAKDLLIDLKEARQELEFQNKLERSAPTNRWQAETQVFKAAGEEPQTASNTNRVTAKIKNRKFGFVALSLLLFASIGFGHWVFTNRSANAPPIESIAILPFVNENGNAENEYLSDGMTETLISSLAQIPKLNVKARSTVFRYKGKEPDARKVGQELNVQAVLIGRVIQRGERLTLSLELVDVGNQNVIWSENYNRRQADLVSLQSEIARDVSSKLKIKLSGADEQNLAKNYTSNSEAYQLYLKGRFHLLKTTRAEFQTSISYFQQAIGIDPSYALAYAGLADAYRSLSIAGEMPSMEVMPKAKAAGQKAIEIDDTLAEAHAVLGFVISLYDWDWNAAENHYKRALELDPNNADAHYFYGYLLSITGRHDEALAEGKRARELDPLNLRTNAFEGQFLIHAGRAREALAGLQKTSELDANYWLPHLFASSAYIEEGMYSEAIAEARQARELSGASTTPIAFLGYALAKSGKQAETRAELERLLKLSTERYVSLYNIAMIYNGLGERDKTLEWLEKGYQQRDPRMVFLKVEPKWNNLRSDSRFQDLLRRVGFLQ